MSSFSSGGLQSRPDFTCKITSVGGNDDGVLSLGIILYTWRNCSRDFSLGVPQLSSGFFLVCQWSAWPACWILGDMGWLISKVSQKSFKSQDVNCVPLLDLRQSTTPNLVNSSSRKLIVTSVVGFLHLKTLCHFEKLSTTIRE